MTTGKKLCYCVVALLLFFSRTTEGQDIKPSELKQSWQQNYESIGPIKIAWQYETIVLDAYAKQLASEHPETGVSGDANVNSSRRLEDYSSRKPKPLVDARGKIYWHSVAIDGNCFQHRKVAGEGGTRKPPPELGEYPASKELVINCSQQESHRCMITARTELEEYITWIYSSPRELHFYESEKVIPARFSQSKKGLLISGKEGLKFSIPSMEHLDAADAEVKMEYTEDGNIDYQLTAIGSRINSLEYGARHSWVLDPEMNLLPLSYEMYVFRRSLDGEELGVVSRRMEFRLGMFEENPIVEKLNVKHFNEVEETKGEDAVLAQTLEEKYELLDISKLGEGELEIAKPQDCLVLSGGDKEVEFNEALRDQIESLNETEEEFQFQNQSWGLTFFYLLACVFLVVLGSIFFFKNRNSGE